MSQQLRKRKRDDPKARRERIIDEAIRILGQLGYHGFTVQDLAKRCDLSNAGLLYYFPSKEQLFDVVVMELEQREIHALAPFIEAVERGERTRPPLTAIIDLLHAMVARADSNPEFVRFYAVLQVESLDKEHPAHDSFRQRESAVLELFSRLIGPYVKEPLSTARQLLALMDGLRLQWLRSGQCFDAVSEWIRAVTVLVPALVPLRKKHGPESSTLAKVGARTARRKRPPQAKNRRRPKTQTHRQKTA